MGNLDRIKVVDYTCGRRSSDDVNTDIPFSDNFAKTRTLQQANVVLGAYVNRNYKDNRQWLTELENKADKDEIPEKTSDLTNDGSDGENPFITNQVDDLINYTNNTDLNNIITPIENMLDGTKPAGNMIVDSIRSKNMFDGILEQYSYGFGDGIRTYNPNYCSPANKIPVIAGKTYTLSFVSSIPITLNDCGFVFFNNGTYVGSQQNTLTVTVPNGANYMVFNISAYPNTITPSDISNVQLEEGSTATTYFPYQNLNGMEIYSSSEIVVGSFLGKPLYRKVFTGTFAGGTNTTINNVLPLTCTVRNIYGTSIEPQNFNRRTLPYIIMDGGLTYYISVMSTPATSGINLVFFYSQEYNTHSYEVVIEYTKTTD